MNTTFLTTRDIANILRISRALAYRLIAQGEIPSIQFGRVSRVRQEDLEAFLQKCMRKPQAGGATVIESSTDLPRKGDVQKDT
jgi:excisionase family DNA binding protein